MNSSSEQPGNRRLESRLQEDRQSSGIYNALSLRRRSVWEAADSGVLLWRNSFVYFIPFFAVPVWIIACGLRFLPGNYYYLSYLILWWLKPLFDRLALHVVSRRFFSTRTYAADRELRSGLLWSMVRGLAGDLLWRRFSPYRASRMPVRVLERAGGSQYKLRKRALIPGGTNFCSIISAFGLAAEAALLFGEIAFTAIAVRMLLPASSGFLQDNLSFAGIFVFAAFCFNYILVESLYVCMGFGLYINSRVEVEGWDLQLLFQKFAAAGEHERKQGHEPGQNRMTVTPDKTAAILCFFLALFLAPASRVICAEQNTASVEAVDLSPEDSDFPDEGYVEFFPRDFPVPEPWALDNLSEILASADFGSEKEGWEIRLKQSGPPPDMPEINFSPWMETLKKLLGYMLRFFVILAIAAFLGFSLFWLLKNRRTAFPGRRSFRFRRGEGYANPLHAPEYPETIFARSELLFNQGSYREAWAACLSGCIGAYRQYRSLSFPQNATEYDCLALVQETLPGEADGFEKLVRDWVFYAYGGRLPPPGAFEEALAHGRSIGEAP